MEKITSVDTNSKHYAALPMTDSITFINTSNEHLIAYLQEEEEGEKYLLIIVNLDPKHHQSGWIQIPASLAQYGRLYSIKDQHSEMQYDWDKEWNYVEWNSDHKPTRVFTFHQQR